MKGMKRILSLFCAAVVLCTGINLSYAAESADGGYSEYKYMIDILNALNITKISEKGFSATDKVSRETFALSVAQMMSDDPQSLAAEPTGDLTAKDAGMLYLRSVGLIDGTDENVYEPKRNITLEQAIKISVSALGYGDISYYKGGYSSGFIGEAKRAGLLDGVNAPSASDLELGDCVKLLYNLLRTDVLEQKTFGSSNTYYRVDGNTLVSVYRNIRRGEGYTVSERLKALFADGSIIKPSINTAYVFSFNSLGELVYMDEVSEKGYRVAYFKRFALGDGSIDPERKVRVFDQSGNWETYTLAKNIKLNGNRIKSNTLKNMDLYIGKVCKYELNIAGEVTSLYFPSEDDENFRTVYSIKNAYYRTYSAGGYFGAQNDKNAAACSLDPSACVFVVPNKEPADVNELADGYQYAVLLPGKLKTYITYSSVEIYNTTGEIGIGDAAVAKIKNNGYAYNHYGDRPIVISNIENTMVGDEVKPVINGYYNGNTIQIIIDDHRSDQSTLPLKSGDAIYCFTQDDGELRLYDDLQYYHKILDYDEQNPVFAQSFNWNLASPVGVSYSSSLSGDQRIRFGSVYKVNSDYLWLNVSDDPSDTSAVEAAKCSNARVYVYDKDDEEFEIGKVSDIVGYTSDRTNYSKALIVYNGGFTEIVIY